MALIVLVMIVYMLPNPWIGKVLTSMAIVAGFFIYAGLTIKTLTANEFAAGIVFVVLVLFIRAVGSYNNEYQRRMLFIKSRKLERLSRTDPMTGAYNRASLSRHIQDRMDKCRIEGHPLTLIILDIDDFKKINDRYGHLMGDKVLIDIVDLVRSRLQDTDLLFRWGGEEFIVLLQAPLAQAEVIAEDCRRSIAEIVYEGSLGVSCSFGLTEYREGDNMDTILARADQKLYLAKANGKNRVEV
ncbi:diguanylate cyclase (GGDEF) domain-containing protein [Acetanaerobacterium elongatum]|uniref:Diguanylate cyclase (GGDEF) domain-containing protein n=2 Tax=Acetanaerobacterium elongatum TaxID=258515 RepID=A0A1H0FP36_9FIRM|nr:diguanylate cyclase (GGDEF) domain-containing protein [Acetanaerobacterium elongatum]